MWECENCRKENKDDRKECWNCSIPKGMTLAETQKNSNFASQHSSNYAESNQPFENQTIRSSISGRESALLHRYTDAYLVAKVTVGIGSLIKTVGIIFAALIFLSAFGLGSYITSGNGNGVILISVLVVGASYAFTVGFVFYVIGIIVSANGQVLKATLDNTVGNSPFLTNNLKARVMSLPEE